MAPDKPLPLSSKAYLDKAKAFFENHIITSDLETNVFVRRHIKSTRFSASDLVFELVFRQNRNSHHDVLVLSVLMSIFHALQTLVRQMRHFFPSNETYYVSFASFLKGMSSPALTGMMDLHKDDRIADTIAQSIYLFLTSNEELRLDDSPLKIQACVFSPEHSADYAKRRGPPKRPFPLEENDSFFSKKIGTLSAQNKLSRKKGVIMTPLGYPGNEHAFDQKCLLASCAMALELQQTYFREGKAAGNALAKMFKSLSQPSSSKKMKTEAGILLLRKMQLCIEGTNVPFLGPHTYQQLDVLSAHHNVQIVLFSDLCKQSIAMTFPCDQQWSTSRPTLYLYETNTFNPEKNATEIHLNVVYLLESFFSGQQFPCRICLQWISKPQQHLKCSHRRRCTFCFRAKLVKNDYFDCSSEKQLCPALLLPEDKANWSCVHCNALFSEKMCWKLHLELCGGIVHCRACRKAIKANKKRNQDLKLQVSKHQCFQRQCRLCFQPVPAHIKVANHCCPVAAPKFPHYMPGRLEFKLTSQ